MKVSGIFSSLFNDLAIPAKHHIDIVAIEGMSILKVIYLHASTCLVEVHHRKLGPNYVPAIYTDEQC
jgi:hypothetical protein